MTVIVPARNEEACLGACLESLAAQAGVQSEVIVVNDGSTDRTAAIARSFANVRLLDAPALPPGWTGKTNAMAAGACAARGDWLLFTDADTVHLPASLSRSLSEAQSQRADLLSYSPRQEVRTFWEKAVMPVIFAELASRYRPREVSDPASPAAAANGQYLLISRAAYDAVGGHAAVAADLLEDVALARLVKKSGRRIFFRYGADTVCTRMYRSFAQLRDGWTKNLAALFPSPGRLAILRSVEFVLIAGGMATSLIAAANREWALGAVGGTLAAGLLALFFGRIRKAHFAWDANLLSPLGLPLFAYLLLRSKLSYRRGLVRWKQREYDPAGARPAGHVIRRGRTQAGAAANEGQTWSI